MCKKIYIFFLGYLITVGFKNKKIINNVKMFLAGFIHAEEAFVT